MFQRSCSGQQKLFGQTTIWGNILDEHEPSRKCVLVSLTLREGETEGGREGGGFIRQILTKIHQWISSALA